MKNDFKNLLNILDESLMSISEDKFTELVQDCAAVLRRDKKIIVSGLGKNVPICDKFVGTMNSLGLNACFMHTNSAVHGDLGMIHSGDLIIILTKSGETSESVYLYKQLQKKDCLIWLLTFEKESTLAKAIEKVLLIELQHEGDKWNIMPNNSTTLNLIVLQMLAMRLCDELDISLADFKENHPGGHIGEELKNV